MNLSLSLSLSLSLLTVVSAHAWDANVRDLGAKGDGKADDTTVFQAALDRVGDAGGGIVYVPAGHYSLRGNLSVPAGVTLKGTFEAPPEAGTPDAMSYTGTTLMAYAGRGEPDAAPFIRLAGNAATVKGLIITYPEWSQQDVPPVPYPPTIFSTGTVNVSVQNVCLMYCYDGIRFITAHRHLVRGVYGYPSNCGLSVDMCGDIGRIENVHFWPFGVQYLHDDPYCQWVNVNGTAFRFARTDWEYVHNTFCFGYGIGYHFTESEHGSANGNFLGIGADSCRRAVLVDQAQYMGLLITNGEFVGRWGSEDSVCLEISPDCGGTRVSLQNCAFWGPIDTCVWSRSPKAQFTAVGCNFSDWDNTGRGAPALQFDAGRAVVNACLFGDGSTHAVVGEGVRSALFTGNQAEGGLRVRNQAGPRLQLSGNEGPMQNWLEGSRDHYVVDVGSEGDLAFVADFHQREPAFEWGNDGTKRWSRGVSRFRLPVTPGVALSVAVDVMVPMPAVAPDNGLYDGDTCVVRFPENDTPRVVSGTLDPGDRELLELEVRVREWVPEEALPDSTDPRPLGVAVRSLTIQNENASGDRVWDACQECWLSTEQGK